MYLLHCRAEKVVYNFCHTRENWCALLWGICCQIGDAGGSKLARAAIIIQPGKN